MRLPYTAAMLAAAASSALALTTSQWTDSAEADFAAGEMQAVVASKLGDLKLSRSVTPLLQEDPRVNVVYALRELPDGSIAIGTGPEGMVLLHQNGAVRELHKAPPGALVTALEVDGTGKLLVGLSGESAGLLRIDPVSGVSERVFQSAEVTFIWAIAALKDGTILLGTGPSGQLIEIAPGAAARVIWSKSQNNILTLLPGEDPDEVLVGTDPDGLVIRVQRKSGEWFVLYDANEPEIVALTRDAAGNLFAAASAVVEAAPPETPAAGPGGLPAPGKEIPLTREPAAPPSPPELPDPTPGEPEPIPKAPPRLRIMETIEAAAPTTAPEPPATTETPAEGATAEAASAEESAVYCISRSGFVSEVFRRAVTIHSMVYSNGVLLIGTGPAGQVFEVQPATEESVALAQVNARQVSAMSLMKNGELLLGLSNPGGISTMGAGYSTRGTYTSAALDAEQVARFGKMQLQGTLAAGTAATVAVRSGNVKDPEIGGWSPWSEEKTAAEFVPVAAPSARFLQYRLTLSTSNPANTPVIDEVRLSYLLPNMAPKIESVQVEPEESGSDAGPAAHTIAWEVKDANEDRLSYSIFYRLGYRGEWVLLKDKIEEPTFTWNTRQLADGRYQVRVVASDAQANALGEGLTGMRFSETIVIDNTPPAIGDIKTQQMADGMHVSLRAVDRTSTVAAVEYAVDASADWQAVPSSDMLYDSPDETVAFVLSKLAVGQHQLSVRARDGRGNTAYETLVVAVQEPERK